MKSLLLPVFLCVAGAARADFDVPCPESIVVSQQLAQPVETWEGMDARRDQRHRLRAAAFYDGHPGQMAQLREARFKRANGSGGVDILTFKFSASYPDGIWLACLYEDTSVIVARKLPQDSIACEITYTRRRPPAPVLTTRCK